MQKLGKNTDNLRMTNKVLLNILPSKAKGGMEEMFLNYSKILSELGYKIYCLVPEKFCYFNELEKFGIEYRVLNVSGHYDFCAMLKLRAYIKNLQPNLLIAHNGRSFALINFLRLITRINVKSLAISHGGSIKRISGFDYAIAISNKIYSELSKLSKPPKIWKINNFIDYASTSHEIESNSLQFGILARFTTEKNVMLAIKAFKEFYKKHPRSKLIIAGSGELEMELKNESSNCSGIKFIGWVKNKEDFFSKINILLLTSSSEAFGLSILEAMQRKKLVISADCDGPKEIVKDGVNGILFSKNNYLDLVKKMELATQIDRENITKNASMDFSKKYSSEAAKNNIKTCFEKML